MHKNKRKKLKRTIKELKQKIDNSNTDSDEIRIKYEQLLKDHKLLE